ncbi:DUF1460 domain-containing protein [Pseudomonas nabeulensis]|uniref:DUF1460 domain-containing protein n=1 Tax=Pseudomonas nabeulensis TaxID=2293833 RepID=A0A4Z0B9A1_9PSED|nr:DUF1460 domain-containing protein [Pseudomonas nabeulensis]TFY95311.1 DUF1460 domain-containing protein [Pseudomonas nabeulensis]
MRVLTQIARAIPLSVIFALTIPYVSAHERVDFIKQDQFTAEKVDGILRSKALSRHSTSHGDVIASVSSAFLATPYQANRLIGSSSTTEVLVADLSEVDCLTLIDYVEALTRSSDEKTFIKNLVRTRYVDGRVDYRSRKHFFSDWYAATPANASDVTKEISHSYITAEKELNSKPDGGEYVPGLGITHREINYIPTHAINQTVINRLETGDYIGIYSPSVGLDVSHVGIVIKNEQGVWFRNASSKAENMRVVDSPFMEYVASTPGIVVLRAE